jgi:hypothetical protein
MGLGIVGAIYIFDVKWQSQKRAPWKRCGYSNRKSKKKGRSP